MAASVATAAAPFASDPATALRRFLFFLLMTVFVFLPGIRLGGMPLPMAFLPCLFYFVLLQPGITRGGLALYCLVFAYMLAVSTRNAVDVTGGPKDFFYIGLCVLNFAVTLVLMDVTRNLPVRTIAKIITLFFAAETVLQLVQYFIPPINDLMMPLLRFWASTNNTEGYLTVAGFAERTPGSFGSPTVAGTLGYLMIRSVAVLTGRRWLIYLGLIPIIVGGARMTLIIFVLWEVILPILVSRHRIAALSAAGALTAVVAVIFVYFPEILRGTFLFNFFLVFNSLDLIFASDSGYRRLLGLEFALDRIGMILTFGGVTARQFAAYETAVFSFDSELVLRSLQFGLFGYGLLILMNIWTGFDWRDRDWWFGVALILISSTVTSLATGFMNIPFLVLYNLCLMRARQAKAEQSAPAG